MNAQRKGLVGIAFWLLLTVLSLGGCSDPNRGSESPNVGMHAHSGASLTAAQQAQVQKILLDSVQHYQSLLDSGKTALGTTPYPDGPSAIQAAIDDSNSPAARFADWRRRSKAEHDMSYLDAYSQADAFYSDPPEREPAAIHSWNQDMDGVQQSLYEWVLDAYAWQVGSKSSAELTASEQKLQDALGRATQDAMAMNPRS